MDQLTVEEVADLRDPVRRLCADRFDRSGVRESGEPQALDRGAWTELAEVGVFSAMAPEDRGGLGLGVTPLAGLLEECGQGLAPGPLVWNALAAEVVDGAGDGSVLVAGAPAGARPLVVAHAAEADRVVVLGEDVRVHAGAKVTPLAGVDPLTAVARVELDGDGEVIGDGGVAERWRSVGACLSASYLVGLSRLALEVATTHARDRVQFGRPIAGFQAVKHMLADMLVGAEVASAAVGAAAAALDAEDPDAARACSVAKVLAGDAARLATKHCIQIHGGMGYTWEADPHLLWKRAMVYDNAFAPADAHASAIAARLGS